MYNYQYKVKINTTSLIFLTGLTFKHRFIDTYYICGLYVIIILK